MRALACAALVAFAAGVPASADPGPKLDMIAFFTGKTHGENVIKIAMQHPHKLIVDSIGGRNKEGEFVLIDNVQEERKAPRKRTWVRRPSGPTRFTGSLSDAQGPVDIVVSGDTATVRYTMKEGGLKIVQQLKMQPNGTLTNHTIAKKFGMKFGQVDGTIRKAD